jgi:hypothetical protein
MLPLPFRYKTPPHKSRAMQFVYLITAVLSLPSEPIPPTLCPQIRVIDTAIRECLKDTKVNCYCVQVPAFKAAEAKCGRVDTLIWMEKRLQKEGCL